MPLPLKPSLVRARGTGCQGCTGPHGMRAPSRTSGRDALQRRCFSSQCAETQRRWVGWGSPLGVSKFKRQPHPHDVDEAR